MKRRLWLNLQLFEGEGAAPGAEGGGAEGTAAQGGGEGETEGNGETAEEIQPTPEERKAAYEKMKADYGDMYAEDMGKAAKRYEAETSKLQKQLEAYGPLMDMLGARFGVKDGNVEDMIAAINSDKEFFEAAALKEGLTVEQYKGMLKLQTENRQMKEAALKAQQIRQRDQTWARWDAEAERCKQKYPGFDMNKECQSEEFRRMLGAGVDVTTAYQALHHDELVGIIATGAQTEAKKKLSDTIRAGAGRPTENGIKNNSASGTKIDVSKLTDEQMDELIERVKAGEHIEL